MATEEDVASVLERMAANIENAPVQLVGAQINLTGGAGGGSATGLHISVASGPAGTHTTGLKIDVDPDRYHRDAADLVRDLREAAALASQQRPPKSWVKSLLDRATSLGNRALDGVVAAAAEQLMRVYGAF